jgi:hypothetical protein
MMNGEKGQALPLAILVLAIGSLVVAPFLGHAGASLTGSRVYGQGLAEIYACDAGVEHAIWSLTRGGLADAFTGPGDQVTYELPEEINGLTATVTITANATASGGAPGEIEDGVIDSQIFDNNSATDPDIVHVSGDVYAIAYQSSSYYYGSPGYLKTVSIAADGQIANYVIDSLTFDSSRGASPDIIHVSGNIYAIAYQGVGSYYGSPGYLKTFTIYSSGQISNYAVDSLTFESGQCAPPDIIHVSGDVYAIAYQTSSRYSSPGELKTVTISSNGQINNYVIDSLVFDGSQGEAPRLVPVSGDVYAVAYQGPGDDGFIHTASISSSGQIGNSVIDTLEFDTGNGGEPDIIQVSGDTFAIAYRGQSDDGFLKTVSISADGEIAGSIIDSLEFDTGSGYGPDIIEVSEGVFAIAYQGPSSRGYIKTVGIGTGGGTEAAYEIVASAGGRAVRAFVNVNGEAASIVSWRTE